MKELWYCTECMKRFKDAEVCVLISSDEADPPTYCPYDDTKEAYWQKHTPETDWKTKLLNKANEGE